MAEKTEDEQMEDIERGKDEQEEEQVDQRKKIIQERQTFLDHLRSGTSLPPPPPTTTGTPPERPPRYQFMTDIPFDQVNSMDLYVLFPPSLQGSITDKYFLGNIQRDY